MRRPVARPGLSLLEVLIALAVLLISLTGLGYLLTMAGNLAQQGQMRTEAAQLCQSKLAELAAGATPLSSGEGAFEEAPQYQWSVSAEQGAAQGLWNVTVRVSRERPGGSRIQVALNQMILDPSAIGSTQDAPPSSTTTAADTSATGGSSGSTPTPPPASGGN